jgi:hypothetical protein
MRIQIPLSIRCDELGALFTALKGAL